MTPRIRFSLAAVSIACLAGAAMAQINPGSGVGGGIGSGIGGSIGGNSGSSGGTGGSLGGGAAGGIGSGSGGNIGGSGGGGGGNSLNTNGGIGGALNGSNFPGDTSTKTTGNSSSGQKVDCSALASLNCRKDITMDPKAVQECMRRGYDAPRSCRKDEGKSAGVRVGGSSGFSYSTVQAPQNPPGAMGAAPSVSDQMLLRSFGFPPWSGFPCKLPGGIDLCQRNIKPYTPVDPDDPCPVKSDTQGIFGKKMLISSGGALALPCGGAVPLTIYELTLNKNPQYLASTEYNGRELYLFQKSGASYKPVSGSPFRLPSVLCKDTQTNPVTGKPVIVNDANGKPRNRSVDLTATVAQMITYNASTPSITLRLKSRASPGTNDASTLSEWSKMKPKYKEGDPEMYLVVPIKAGMPEVPENCAEDKDYYKDIRSAQFDMLIESAVEDPCESGNPANCGGTPTAPSPNDNCEVASMRNKGHTGTAASCNGGTQYLVLDRPNLYYPPGSSVTVETIQGRAAVMVPTVANSELFVPSGTIMRFGTASPDVTLKEGGTLWLQDGGKVVMNGPVTLNPSSGRVTMTGGGERKNAGGAKVQNIASGTVYTPPGPVIPMTVTVKRSASMTAGYSAPSQNPSPYVQLPLDKP